MSLGTPKQTIGHYICAQWLNIFILFTVRQAVFQINLVLMYEIEVPLKGHSRSNVNWNPKTNCKWLHIYHQWLKISILFALQKAVFKMHLVLICVTLKGHSRSTVNWNPKTNYKWLHICKWLKIFIPFALRQAVLEINLILMCDLEVTLKGHSRSNVTWNPKTDYK